MSEEPILDTTNSILTSIKLMLGIPADYEYFDQQIIVHINSVFGILHQLGVGTSDPYEITGASETWDEFLEDKKNLNLVKTFMFLKVKMVFDPESSGFTTTSIAELAKEYEWRLYMAEDQRRVDELLEE